MANRCGNCIWTQPVPQDLNLVECYGAPPQLLVLPQQMPDGSAAMGIQMVRPNLPRATHSCSRFEAKPLQDIAQDGHGV